VTTGVPNQPNNTFGTSGPLSKAPTVGRLPFTGLGLLLVAVLGLALLASGLGIRARLAG
jgi:hypothetical protein